MSWGLRSGNTDQLIALAGCDNLTISPALLEELDGMDGTLERVLSPEKASGMDKIAMDEKTFRWEMNADAMATEKLAEGIRGFDADHQKLVKLIADRI